MLGPWVRGSLRPEFRFCGVSKSKSVRRRTKPSLQLGKLTFANATTAMNTHHAISHPPAPATNAMTNLGAFTTAATTARALRGGDETHALRRACQSAARTPRRPSWTHRAGAQTAATTDACAVSQTACVEGGADGGTRLYASAHAWPWPTKPTLKSALLQCPKTADVLRSFA